MKRIRFLLGATILMAIPDLAIADELRPLQSFTATINNTIANVFYVDRGEVFEVVTTMITDDAEAVYRPVRSIHLMRDGDVGFIEIGRPLQEVDDSRAHADSLRLRRTGATLTVDVGNALDTVNFRIAGRF
jgi:hypothetical protein